LKAEEGRYNNFDLLRLLAAVQVMFCHAIEYFKIPLNNYIVELVYAFPGVPIFFALVDFLSQKVI
jgi:peptidoglycan/LPS O-acetylase OafA/YrhL